jgi:hypothetical protein
VRAVHVWFFRRSSRSLYSREEPQDCTTIGTYNETSFDFASYSKTQV